MIKSPVIDGLFHDCGMAQHITEYTPVHNNWFHGRVDGRSNAKQRSTLVHQQRCIVLSAQLRSQISRRNRRHVTNVNRSLLVQALAPCS